jgi:fumarate reductase flavoprotein subunit
MDKIGAKTDVAVIGAGAAGLSAAITAAEGGAKVILFEKQRSMGGAANFFEGIFAVESDLQRRAFVDYSRDQAFKNIMDYSHWRANPRLVRAIVDESAATIAWLQEQGVEFIGAVINMPGSPRTYHVVKGYGEAAVKALASSAKEKGVDIRLATPAKRLLREGNRITGVIAETEGGEEVEAAAQSVFIGSGGYANNKEWIKKYTGYDLDVNLIPLGNVGKLGDGIRMAWEVGAAEEVKGVLEVFRSGPLAEGFDMRNPIEFAAIQPDLWVNQRGERFCDESITFNHTFVGNANARFKEGYTYSIFDESIKQRLIEKGVENYVGWENPPGSRPVGIDEMINAVVERGSTDVFAADSVEELAEKTGIDPAVLKATVEEYNSFCEKGHDDLFAKDQRYLWPLKGPKFYAVKARSVFIGTLGGIRINQRTEVEDKKGNIIPGLYAGGYDAAGGIYGDSYCFKVSSGLSVGFAINSGRIAGKNILKYIGK